MRNIDWDLGAERVAESGDYVAEQPHLLGTERTGPDLSQAGGEHPDDWHLAHFVNPRFTRPESLMPNFAFLGVEKLKLLIAYEAGPRVQVGRPPRWTAEALEGESRGSL